MQAASGQWEVMRKRESIDAVIEDPDTPAELAERLHLLGEARDFSVATLGLPDNKSYRTYADWDLHLPDESRKFQLSKENEHIKVIFM